VNTDVREQLRAAEERLADCDPLGALEVLRPLGDALRSQPTGQLLLGRAYYLCNELQRAQEALERAVALDPRDGEARFALGRTLERRRLRREALHQLRLAAALTGREEHRQRADAVASALREAA
jgi:tetratricopeptide (TPR) repeat protein